MNRRSVLCAISLGGISLSGVNQRHDYCCVETIDDLVRQLAHALEGRHGGAWQCDISKDGRYVMLFKLPSADQPNDTSPTGAA